MSNTSEAQKQVTVSRSKRVHAIVDIGDEYLIDADKWKGLLEKSDGDSEQALELFISENDSDEHLLITENCIVDITQVHESSVEVSDA